MEETVNKNNKILSPMFSFEGSILKAVDPPPAGAGDCQGAGLHKVAKRCIPEYEEL